MVARGRHYFKSTNFPNTLRAAAIPLVDMVGIAWVSARPAGGSNSSGTSTVPRSAAARGIVRHIELIKSGAKRFHEQGNLTSIELHQSPPASEPARATGSRS